MASAQKKMVKSKSRRQMAEPQKNPLEVELLANLKRETARAGNGLTCVSLPEKQQFCQKLLADGRPKAFVELFQLTHTLDSEVIPAEVGNDARSVSQQRNLSNKEMLRTLSNHLIDAELAVRAGDAELLFVAYLEVAKLFDYSGDFEKAIAYYFKCFAAAEKTCNIFHECQEATHLVKSNIMKVPVSATRLVKSNIMKVMFNLGKVYWKLQDSLKAINSFEDCLALARTNNNHGRAMLAAENLLEIYWKCAEQSKQVGDHLKSIEYFEKCVSMAKACQNLKLGGEAKYNIGLLYGLILQPSTSLKYLEDFLQLCYNMNDKKGECKSHFAMAREYETRGDIPSALSHLEYFLVAAQYVDLATQARGYCALGMIYAKHQQLSQALKNFETCFQIAQLSKSLDMLDAARVNIGIVRSKLCFLEEESKK